MPIVLDGGAEPDQHAGLIEQIRAEGRVGGGGWADGSAHRAFIGRKANNNFIALYKLAR